jgi:AraC-like DNA-binding protein
MSQTSERSVPSFPRAAGLMTRLAYEHASKLGLPASVLARRSGLTLRAIRDSQTQLDAREQATFLNSVAAALDDDFLGFHLAQQAELRAAGLFYYVLTSSSRLIEVFQRGARYTSLVNEGVRQTCIDRRCIGLELHPAGAAGRTNRHEIQFWITTVLRLSRELTGQRLAPQRVCFAHQRGRRIAEFANYFSCDVDYGAAQDSIVFDRRDRELPIVNADSYLNRLLIDFCEEAMRRQSSLSSPLVLRIENAIATRLPHGEASMGAVARSVGLSERTLARRLAAEELGFAALRTRLRRDLANRYLTEAYLSISEISWLLGFRDVATFSHAFKRWTGMSPREVRAGSRPPR